MSIHHGISPTLARRAVTSIVQQDFPDFELLIMLDGPQAEGIDLVIRGVADDPRVRVLSRERRAGLAAAMNSLIRVASGEFIARMDADDSCAKNRLTRQVMFLMAHSSAAAVGTFANEVDAERHTTYRKKLPTSPPDLARVMAFRDPFIHPSVMMRRATLTHFGGYSEDRRYRYLEDTELWRRMLLGRAEFWNLAEYLYEFTVDSGFWSRRRGVGQAIVELSIRLDYVRRAGLPPSYGLLSLGTLVVRMLPEPLMRFAYLVFR